MFGQCFRRRFLLDKLFPFPLPKSIAGLHPNLEPSAQQVGGKVISLGGRNHDFHGSRLPQPGAAQKPKTSPCLSAGKLSSSRFKQPPTRKLFGGPGFRAARAKPFAPT